MSVAVCNFTLKPQYSSHRFGCPTACFKSGFSLACSRLSDSRENEKNCVWKASGGLGRGEAGEPVSISFRYTSSWYTLWLVNFDSLHQHFRHHFDSRAEHERKRSTLSPSVLKNSQTYKPSDSSKSCVCSTLISRKNDPFAMLPTGFGKSINFQLLPRVAKALQCCDSTSLHTAYNIASPGTIYSSHLTQLLCPMHATIVSIQRRSLKTLTNEKNTIFCYSFLCKYLAAYSNSPARPRVN